MDTGTVRAVRLLLGRSTILEALGGGVSLQVSNEPGTARSIGTVIAAAARDAGYRSYAGSLRLEGVDRPIAVGSMALVFDGTEKAEQTFAHVAEAAHLRTKIGDINVAVETVTSATGLVSYWCFLYLRECMVVMTLDTVDPQIISMTVFRSLVTAAAERIESAVRTA